MLLLTANTVFGCTNKHRTIPDRGGEWRSNKLWLLVLVSFLGDFCCKFKLLPSFLPSLLPSSLPFPLHARIIFVAPSFVPLSPLFPHSRKCARSVLTHSVCAWSLLSAHALRFRTLPIMLHKYFNLFNQMKIQKKNSFNLNDKLSMPALV